MNEPLARDGGRAAEYAYRKIRGQILSGARPGGEWLREEDLAGVIGVSRTPVREALRRLAAEGLIRHERNRGARVQSWSTADIDEVFELRSLLEPWGSRLAAEQGTADLDRLDALCAEMEAAAARGPADIDAITDLNNQFHRAILEASGRSRLAGLVSSVVGVPLVWRTFAHYSTEALQRSLAHHREIVDALRARDASWAESVMRSHIHASWAFIKGDRTEHDAGGKESGGG